jgi:hypothetical protein
VCHEAATLGRARRIGTIGSVQPEFRGLLEEGGRSPHWRRFALSPWLLNSVREELGAQFGFGNVAARLAEDGVEGASVYLIMVGNGQVLGPAVRQNPADLDVAAALRPRLEVELAASASGYRVKLHGGEDSRVVGETERSQVFTLKV